MKNNPRRTLNWFLSFINFDIDSLSHVRLFSLWEDIRMLAYGEIGRIVVSDQEIISWDARRQLARQIQASLKGLLEEILAIYHKKKWENKNISLNKMKYVPGLKGMTILTIKQPDLNIVIHKKIYPFSTNIERNLQTQFIFALSNFELALIQRCQRKDCGGYFLKGTEKEKRYCSKRCYLTEAQRERRKRMKKIQSKRKGTK